MKYSHYRTSAEHKYTEARELRTNIKFSALRYRHLIKNSLFKSRSTTKFKDTLETYFLTLQWPNKRERQTSGGEEKRGETCNIN